MRAFTRMGVRSILMTWEPDGINRLPGRRGLRLLILDTFEQFAAQHAGAFREGESELNRFATNSDDRYLDLVIDDNRLPNFSGQV